MQHISGRDFKILLGALFIQVESMSATITDNTAPAMTQGMPDGYVQGSKTCAGQIVVDSKNFTILSIAAGIAGSWSELEAFTITIAAATSANAQALALYGCKLRIDELINIDPSSTDKTKHTLSFDVTDKDFVKINGVSYASDTETLGIY